MSLAIQVVALFLLVAIALMLARALRGGLVLHVDEATQKLRAAAAHYGDVNAVAELTKQIKNNPELMQDLSVYPRQVVAAALVHRVNAIGSDLGTAQRELSDERRLLAEYGSYHQKDVDRLEELVKHLLEELHQASAAADEFNSLRAVS